MPAWDGGAYAHAVDLTVDAFHALARSSPWRWRSLHFLARADSWDVEAWVVRPGWQLVREQTRDHVTDERRRAVVTDPPEYRPDGLVARRPATHLHDAFDAPLWPAASYGWVAMLDPEELSHHVAVSDLEVDQRHGRETWWATVRALEGYEARCPDCCDLLLGGPARGIDHVVGLDVQTGVLVSLSAPEVTEREWFIENEILAVDGDVVLPEGLDR